MDALYKLDSVKFVFVGGKGGVGKTTSSSAIAYQLALQKRVLLVSTDPAHSLSDAFRQRFSNSPTQISTQGSGSLHVMEIDPEESMKSELQQWGKLAESATADQGMLDKLQSFQEWLSGIPGIDEATALSNAITYIESGDYDLIVFDTAPTGHTLKLLALPPILQAGIDKLKSWQSTIWTVWETMKGFGGGVAASNGNPSMTPAQAKAEVGTKLENYRQQIEKVGLMLQDQQRTRFVVICIAEYLSVSESRRLLLELNRCGVKCSHVVVNQLLLNQLSSEELQQLQQSNAGDFQQQMLLEKAANACKLGAARATLQAKYLKQLQQAEEVTTLHEGLQVLQVPLLDSEVTGVAAIAEFSKLLGTNTHAYKCVQPTQLYETSTPQTVAEPQVQCVNGEKPEELIGKQVFIRGLQKQPDYNGNRGKVISYDDASGRFGIEFRLGPQRKQVSLKRANIELVELVEKINTTAGDVMKSKAEEILQDPEIKAMVEKVPRAQAIIEECRANPMAAMSYMQDPEIAPIITKALGKIMAK